MATAQFMVRIGFLMSGFLIWAAHFLGIYGFNGVVCARNLQDTVVLGFNLVPLVIVTATVIALVLDFLVLAAAVTEQGPGISDEPQESLRQFWRYVTGALAALAFVAIVWDALPALMLPPCA